MSENRPKEMELDPVEQRRTVRERYAEIATNDSDCCTDNSSSTSADVGYGESDLASAAAGADLGLGCGNPTAIANLEPGETVLDLGSGAGFDCFLSSQEVGEAGRVIGVDMTPEMVEKARTNIGMSDAANVEFRLGEIEHLPVGDGMIDVAISNCVINLSPDKLQVFREIARALRPGGRLAISDVVLTADPPPEIAQDPKSVASCVAGAASLPELKGMLDKAGFVDTKVVPKSDSDTFISEWDDDYDPSEFVVAARIEGHKPP